MRPTGKTALVTGATGGLGQVIAHTFTARGVRPVLTGRNSDTLTRLADELDCPAITADITADGDFAALMQQAGPIDILVANAGISGPVSLADATLEEIDAFVAVNLRAPMRMARIAAEQMARQGGGHIVFMSSLGGRIPLPRMSLYCSTKHGLRGFAHAIRADLASHGIGVSVICPTFVRDAGMVTRQPVPLPPWAPTCTAQQVADAVYRAIVTNTAEILVAPWYLRQITRLSGLSPAIPAGINRLTRLDRHAEAITDGLARRQTSHIL
ncbi:SDR family NAD(P)-dependent oxidoreductase [Actinomadura sp. 3N508]|uniref:SDR family NAD(P)-dependent oxidoreductase n=1 Tax=Actinomadura sp. 3N508 TaxID=3375153 RepID=UPI0037AEA93F